MGDAGRYVELIKEVLRPERLEELPEATQGTDRISFLTWLMSREDLPFDEPDAGSGATRASGGLFAAEQLPLDVGPEPLQQRASFIATLFSGESLPEDPVPGPRPAGGR